MNTVLVDQKVSFWEIAGMNKINANYKIDKNLRCLPTLSLSILKLIFIQYRFFTQYYIVDLAILINKMPSNHLKNLLTEILYEELGDGKAADAHPQLYDNFLLSLGIKTSLLDNPNPRSVEELKVIQNRLIHGNWAYGVGLRGMGGECLCQVYLSTMYEYFRQNPYIEAISDSIDWKFWEIHTGPVDIHHQEIIKNAINELVEQYPELAHELIDGYLTSIQAWDNYWEHIFKNATIKN